MHSEPLTVNTALFTRDGRMTGNAIVVKIETQDSIFMITDYGNRFGPLTRSEIDSMFYIGPVNGDHKFAVGES